MKNFKRCFIDIETVSLVDFDSKTVPADTYLYATHESTKTLMACYTFDNSKIVFRYYPGREKIPANLQNFKGIIVAHSFFFEYYNFLRMILEKTMPAHFADITRYECTAALALARGLPRSLNEAGLALRLEYQKKINQGKELINKYSRPYHKSFRGDLFAPENELDLAAMLEYCTYDVLTTRELYNTLPPLCAFEKSIFEFDKIKNSRGIRYDIKSVKKLVGHYETARITIEKHAEKKWGRNENGKLRVSAPLECVKLFHNLGINISSVGKEVLAEVKKHFKDNKEVQEIIAVRSALAVTNVKKLYTMLGLADENELIRNSTTYHAAITGRDASYGVQSQNFSRIKSDTSFNKRLETIKKNSLSSKLSEALQVPTQINAMLRECIISRKGKTFFILDFSTIEPIVLFTIANAKAGIHAFNNNIDIYKFFAAFRFKKDISQVTKDERNLWGKLGVLSFGYGQGAESTAEKENISLDIATDLKEHYFELFPEVKEFHWQLYNDVKTVVTTPGIIKRDYYTLDCNPLRLKIILPSGRAIYLLKPRIEQGKKGLQIVCNDRKGVLYLWYGRLTNFIVQGIARDLLKRASVEAEKDSLFDVGLEIHDEMLVEVPDLGAAKNKQNFQKLKKILETPPAWFPIPIRAEGEISKRYKKI